MCEDSFSVDVRSTCMYNRQNGTMSTAPREGGAPPEREVRVGDGRGELPQALLEVIARHIHACPLPPTPTLRPGTHVFEDSSNEINWMCDAFFVLPVTMNAARWIAMDSGRARECGGRRLARAAPRGTC